MTEEIRTLLIKINPPKYEYLPTEPLPTAPYPPLRNSPEKGEINFFFHHDEKMLDEYNSLSEMAAGINGSCKSKLVEKILYKQMAKLLQ